MLYWYLLFRIRVKRVFRSKQRTKCLAFENGLTEESWFYSRQGRNFSLVQSVRIGSGFHPASDSVAIGVKRPAREAGHSPSSVETENWFTVPPLPHTHSWRAQGHIWERSNSKMGKLHRKKHHNLQSLPVITKTITLGKWWVHVARNGRWSSRTNL